MNKQSPPLVAVSLDLKIARSSQNTSEIAMISCVVHNKIAQDGATEDQSYQNFTYFRKLDQMPLPPDIQ
jgi:DNA polymerase alpha subunit A